MPAFLYEVDPFDRTLDVVFAADAEAAGRKVGCDADAVRHVEKFDQYEPQGEVYPVQWQEYGYRVACWHCEHMVDADICYECDGNYPHEDDPEKAAMTDDDRGVCDDGVRVYCDRVCLERYEAEVERKKRGKAAKEQSTRQTGKE